MSAFFTLAGASTLTKKIGGKNNTVLHGNLMGAAVAAASFGGYVIWSNKEMYKKAHLTTTHGQLGALSLAFFVAYLIPAYLCYNPDNGYLRTNPLARKAHKWGGRICIALGLITCALGITSMEKDATKSAILVGSLLATTPVFLL